MINSEVYINKEIRKYRDRLRILLIIYYFSENYSDSENIKLVKLLKDEVKIQKIDFLIRYPDYLAYELLEIVSEEKANSLDIKNIVIQIFKSEEPTIRKDEMEKFFFGAWESIDDVIAFLHSINFIEFESKRYVDGKIGQKYYYLTQMALDKIDNNLFSNDSLKWYFNRCELIKKYFGDLTGKELRVNQYKHQEYKTTPFKEYIKGIEYKVKKKYNELYKEEL